MPGKFAMNILLIRLKSIGDILFTLPAVHALRENFPDAKLHFLVSGEHAPLLRGFPDISA
jgi:heptosyltransferase-1